MVTLSLEVTIAAEEISKEQDRLAQELEVLGRVSLRGIHGDPVLGGDEYPYPDGVDYSSDPERDDVILAFMKNNLPPIRREYPLQHILS